jgi:TetR/AcrR family transcriptional regulator, repressor of fatR-cypB operon
MDETNLSRKDRERLFRRNEIVGASVKFFAEKGFSSTTLEEIAEAAEYGKGTIYNYFENKEEIYRAIIENVIEGNEKAILDADKNSDSCKDFIEKYTKNLFEFCSNNPYAFLVFVREIAQLNTEYSHINRELIFQKVTEIKKVFINRINSGLKHKEIKKVNAEKVVVIYNHLIFPYLHHLLVCSKDALDVESEIKLILSVFFEGILQK